MALVRSELSEGPQILSDKMGIKKCALYFCVGLVVFFQISTGVLRIILTCMGRTIMPLYLFMGLVYLASGLLLAYGATKQKPKAVLAHLVITITSLVLATIAILYTICFTHLSGGEEIIVYYGIITIVFFGLECAVYNLYKDLKSEPQGVDTQTTSEV